jgi:hypothetical protein
LPDSALKLYWQLFPTVKGAGFVGALVNGKGVVRGTRFAFRYQSGNKILLDTALDSSQVTDGQEYTFSFYGPVTGTGQVAEATPKTIRNLDPDVIAQLQVIFVQNADVEVTGGAVITKGTKILKVTDSTVEVDNPLKPVSSMNTGVRFTFS